MKKKILLFAALYFSLSFGEGWGEAAFAQTNLVPNPSFEDTVACPNPSPLITLAKYWYEVGYTNNSGNYFNACSPSIYWGVPQNAFGFQTAQDSFAYAGVFTAVPTNYGNHEFRTYIQTKLIDTLKKGVNYTVSFYVSLADSYLYSSPNIGAYFSDTMMFNHHDSVFHVIPQIDNKVTHSLKSKTSWILISDTFTAKGGETWMTIGNFHDFLNTQIDTAFYGNQYFDLAFYYIDNVSVIENKKEGVQEIPKIKAIIFPNPTSNLINIKLSDNINAPNKAIIYNENGVEVWSRNNITDKQFKIDLTILPSGIYIFQLQSQNNLITKKITKL